MNPLIEMMLRSNDEYEKKSKLFVIYGVDTIEIGTLNVMYFLFSFIIEGRLEDFLLISKVKLSGVLNQKR